MSDSDSTVTLIHHSHTGRLWINGVGEVDPDTEFEVTTEDGWRLLEQTDLYEQTGGPTPPPPASEYDALKVGELKALATDRGIQITSDAKKADIISALTAADNAKEATE